MSTKYNVQIAIDSEDYAVILNALQSRAARLKDGPKLDRLGDIVQELSRGYRRALQEDFRNAR